MNVALVKNDSVPAASSVFSAAQGRLPGAGKVADIRREAFAAFERTGLPHRRIEEWKYTDLRALVREVLPLAGSPEAAALARAKTAIASVAIAGAAKLVLVDGVVAADLSDLSALPSGVTARALRDVLSDQTNDARGDLLLTKAADPMLSLNAALATDGVVVTVADGVQLSSPLQLIHVATASKAARYSRSHVRIGQGARATLVESCIAADGAGAYQANDVAVIWIGDGAALSHVRLMSDTADAVNIASELFTVGAKSKLSLFNMTSGGAVSRLQAFFTLAGEGSDLIVNGVNLLRDKQHGDMTLVVDHAVPGCTSRENFRAVLDDRAHSVFQGRIIVRPDAQQTDGKMMTRALLLSDEAEADAKPELEIFADDVSCGHGATAGALDDSLLFYLQARGLPEKQAQALLIQAFVGEAIEAIEDDALRERVIAAAQDWMEARA
ncbi:Fe-S cluster assembly protein SufD [Bradyrhizobium sp. SSBR45G]|uniref:Fe-S cluster assembly protein SufD n=1 Tax=unclassified Bradyrhizobium TaxID=2631580 RepID=UPI002342ACAB|nr:MULTISPECIES: Fe-S cluster assembly protein SufD [unclassified Bradyrhizobium]GLH75270.1 Fe-S cluster assembly protein SufD [Bradyrhizobium sp. SSBR45G]GLH82943.1 Fe-S cluster assembly protein SufD [Bradyrhizobium sp. SSBR45R]